MQARPATSGGVCVPPLFFQRPSPTITFVAVGIRAAVALACALTLAGGGTALGHPADSALDPDHDGHLSTADNCPDSANQAQTDTDRDGDGDVCDDDDDGDRVDDATDNCRLAANTAQTDTDLD